MRQGSTAGGAARGPGIHQWARRGALWGGLGAVLAGLFALAFWAGAAALANTAAVVSDPCVRPPVGSEVPEPANLRSVDGVLRVELSIHSHQEPDGTVQYCYTLPDGRQAPTLRLHPGDRLILRLTNDLLDVVAALGLQAGSRALGSATLCKVPAQRRADPCDGGPMGAAATNLHFHGLTVPAQCHKDDVLRTVVQPGDPPFEYRFEVPRDEPPGLYWYHPHIHGFSSRQVSGGASGALIVEGLERAQADVAGLPERVFVIRDQPLANPNAPPSKSEPVVPKNLLERDGDAANNGTGFGKPARDLSINYVPVPYPDYPPARIAMKPGERQLWRVANASAITYLNLALIFQDNPQHHTPQQLGIVAIDGVPINVSGTGPAVTWVNHIGVPPGARVEFIVNGPPLGVPALFATRTVDTGQGGENDPNRALAAVVAVADAPEPPDSMPAHPQALPAAARPWIGSVTPARVRKLYFSEKLDNPNDPNSATTFYLTVDGQAPAPFDPANPVPNIVVRQGDVEDWIIENRSSELHAFHIHQLHFQLLALSGFAVYEPFLRDTVNVPYYNGRDLQYPSVRLRMDFRDPDTIGTYVYHCHLLEHEDGGMMGIVQVVPVDTAGNEAGDRTS